MDVTFISLIDCLLYSHVWPLISIAIINWRLISGWLIQGDHNNEGTDNKNRKSAPTQTARPQNQTPRGETVLCVGVCVCARDRERTGKNTLHSHYFSLNQRNEVNFEIFLHNVRTRLSSAIRQYVATITTQTWGDSVGAMGFQGLEGEQI